MIVDRLWRHSCNPDVRLSESRVDVRDNALALRQMQIAYETLLAHKVKTEATSPVTTKTGRVHPRILTLGGDHAIVSQSPFEIID